LKENLSYLCYKLTLKTAMGQVIEIMDKDPEPDYWRGSRFHYTVPKGTFRGLSFSHGRCIGVALAEKGAPPMRGTTEEELLKRLEVCANSKRTRNASSITDIYTEIRL